ncbi:MAG TPA: hypothetical protein EYO32_01675 [Rhodospirillales bacterium]|nr:hypothetical protein [Rhodospirillales bacterium]HIC60488.1 hypothetical protein [Rhodospirillales bacterium]
MERVHITVPEVEQPTDHSQFHDLLLIEFGAHVFEHIIPGPGGVFGDMLGPENSRLLPIVQ